MALEPISATIGGLTALGSSIYGAIASSQANKKANNLISQQRAENKAWYNMKRAEDYTQRTDAQAILKKQKEILDEHYKNARATNIVAGGSDEALAAQKEAGANALSETMSNLGSQAAAYKDNIEGQYRQTDAALNQQQAANLQNQANVIAQAAGQGVSAGLGLIGTGINAPVASNTNKPTKEDA